MGNLIALKTSIEVFSKTYGYLSKSKLHPDKLSDLKVQWASEILEHLNVRVKVIGKASSERSMIFVGNHISYLDIPLLFSQNRDISFLSKEEIARWPVFGAGAKALDTIFVRREKASDRKSAREALKLALLAKKRMTMFPSGTTCVTESKDWRYGAFQVAAEVGALVQAFRLSYTPLRKIAYVGNDFFPTHLFQLVKEKQIEATLEFQTPFLVTDPIKDCRDCQEWAREWTRPVAH